MLNDRERDALRRWYGRDEVLTEVRMLVDRSRWEDLEELLHMRALFPLSRHSELPDYLLADEGGPLFPTNLNPGQDADKWQDAIEVAWEVVEGEVGLSHDDVHRRIAEQQETDWARFMKSVEERDRARGSS